MDNFSSIIDSLTWLFIAFFAGFWFFGWLGNLRRLFLLDKDDEVIVYQEMEANGLQHATYGECILFSDMTSSDESFHVHSKRLTAHLKSATLTQMHPATESTSSTPIATIDQRNAYQLALDIICSAGYVVEVLVGVPRSELRRLRKKRSHQSPGIQQSTLSERRVSPSAQPESIRIVGRLTRVFAVKNEFDADALALNSQTTTSDSSDHTTPSTNKSFNMNVMLPMSSIHTCKRDRSLMPITILITSKQSSKVVGSGELQELVCFKFAQTSEEANNRSTDSVELHHHTAMTFDPQTNVFVEMNDVFGINANDQSECVICLSEQKRVMIGPCRHVCVCSECYRSFTAQKCPICRTAVTWTMEFIENENE